MRFARKKDTHTHTQETENIDVFHLWSKTWSFSNKQIWTEQSWFASFYALTAKSYSASEIIIVFRIISVVTFSVHRPGSCSCNVRLQQVKWIFCGGNREPMVEESVKVVSKWTMWLKSEYLPITPHSDPHRGLSWWYNPNANHCVASRLTSRKNAWNINFNKLNHVEKFPRW